jgi:predicted acyltransferase
MRVTMAATLPNPVVRGESGRKPPIERLPRLMSLDVFRGATMAAMILVNNPGDGPAAYGVLQHSEWNGCTPTDLIFPFFLFIVGVATALSLRSRMERGGSRRTLLAHVVWRSLILFALGVFLNGFPNHYHLTTLRIFGVLQRIALCYLVTAALALWTGWRQQLAAAVACLVGYWIAMRYLPVPGFGVPTHGIPLLDPDRNLAAWLDRKLLSGHLYEITRDPEGLLSTIPAVATCLIGLLTGNWLRSGRTARAKAVGMAAAGVLCVAAGEIFNLWFPINKKLWTSSYVLFSAGLALLCLALCAWVLDIRQLRARWTQAFLVFGKNAIAAYVLSEMVASWMDTMQVRIADDGFMTWHEVLHEYLFAPLGSPANASLLYSLAYVAACWVVMWTLYRKGIFLKV